MYQFKSTEEKEQFYKTITICAENFKKEKSQKQLDRVIRCNLRIVRLGQLNERRGVEYFFNNMPYDEYLSFCYLIYLLENNLYSFKEVDLQWFLR